MWVRLKMAHWTWVQLSGVPCRDCFHNEYCHSTKLQYTEHIHITLSLIASRALFGNDFDKSAGGARQSDWAGGQRLSLSLYQSSWSQSVLDTIVMARRLPSVRRTSSSAAVLSWALYCTVQYLQSTRTIIRKCARINAPCVCVCFC